MGILKISVLIIMNCNVYRPKTPAGIMAGIFVQNLRNLLTTAQNKHMLNKKREV